MAQNLAYTVNVSIHNNTIHARWFHRNEPWAFMVLDPGDEDCLFFSIYSEPMGYFGREAAERLSRFLKAWEGLPDEYVV